ncbi:hypothetical protein MTR67_011747 [Solanum verrucosum]|uniref:50S ribosomal protein L22, chloroplastic n=1 Tax=Solanum verrucosum TaxID=315347 RepID=A0AAF0Q8P6_SOLVR|nr:hypothetical protein MTR67_011747 [Solanum verrucosum]
MFGKLLVNCTRGRGLANLNRSKKMLGDFYMYLYMYGWKLTKWWAGNGIFNAHFVRLRRDINKTELFHLIHRFTRRQLQYLLKIMHFLGEVPYLPGLRNTLSPSISRPLYQYLQHLSPKKVNLVDALVRGMRVEDALLQLQVTVKQASKTVYQVIHSARANAVHNHGFDPDRLLVAEAFLGKGLFKKRLSYHAKGKCGLMVRPECRLTVVLREITPAEEAEIAKLRVSNFKKLTKREKRLVPHKLIETTPIWNRKGKVRSSGTGVVAE